MLNHGFDHEMQFNGSVLNVTEKHAKFIVKLALNNKKTDYFDRFFRVDFGGPDGERTRGA